MNLERLRYQHVGGAHTSCGRLARARLRVFDHVRGEELEELLARHDQRMALRRRHPLANLERPLRDDVGSRAAAAPDAATVGESRQAIQFRQGQRTSVAPAEGHVESNALYSQTHGSGRGVQKQGAGSVY